MLSNQYSRQSLSASSFLYQSMGMGMGAGSGVDAISLDDMSGSMSSFVSKFDVWMTKMNNQVLDSRHKFQRESSELKGIPTLMICSVVEGTHSGNPEQIASYKLQLSKAEESLKEVDMKLQEQKKEITEEEAAIAQLEAECERLESTKGTMQVKLEGLLHEVEAAQTARDRKLADIAAKEARTQPEVEFFQSKLGMDINAVGAGTNEITFRAIDPADLDRTFGFVLDVNQSNYCVTNCPDLSADLVESLCGQLNEDRNFFTFIKRMRAAFCEFAVNN
eukprot:Partr_v1_DN27983_c0_g1_i2_m11706 putative SPC25, NDC80 kinetochore complex component, homolog (S. cerevisiae)